MSQLDDERIEAASNLRAAQMRHAQNKVGRSLYTDGAYAIAHERRRQITQEGYAPEHDDGHVEDLLRAASAYALLHDGTRHVYPVGNPPALWPWAREFWKPTGDPVRDLTKAGALVAAALDAELRARQRRLSQPLSVVEPEQ
jgi:hypothetical protein